MDEKCKFYRHCNGCQLQNLDYGAQLAYKQRRLEYLFHDFGISEPIAGMAEPLHYRNKSQYSFLRRNKTELCCGLYQSKTRSVTPVASCQLDAPAVPQIMADICKLAVSFKLSVYDYQQKKGFLRHVLIRSGSYSGEIMVVLVCSSPDFPKKQQFANALLSRHPEITTLVISVSYSEKMVLGRKQEVLFGSGTITDTLCNKQFIVSPSSFYQVNTAQAQKLYTKAFELAQFRADNVLVDAYCGTGTIGILASDYVKQVIGVENNPSAVADAKQNAALNQVHNIQFHCADAADFMAGYAKTGQKADVVILDPPRAGIDQKCIQSLLKLSPERIIYISCAPETQARDFKGFLKGGYQVADIAAYDMFPMTKHIETVALLTK